MLYNVLVVDDDKRSAQGLAAMITVLGHTVGIAYGPRMAMQQLNEVIPDIIFLDVNMPGIDGIEVLRYLRRDPYTSRLPVVIVSANETEEDKQQAFDAGANDYMTKPPKMEDIEAVIEKILSKPAQAQPDSVEPASTLAQPTPDESASAPPDSVEPVSTAPATIPKPRAAQPAPAKAKAKAVRATNTVTPHKKEAAS